MSTPKGSGIRFALLAYLSWGLLPLYWKLIKHVPSMEILFHRIIWSWVFYSVLQSLRTHGLDLGFSRVMSRLKVIIPTALLLSANWFLYIYAVNSDRVVESSLGYFMNPLVNVLLGVVILKEKLKSYQKVALCFALAGVGVLTWDAHAVPWISLGLAFTFSFYGLIRKQTSLNSLEGGQLESLMMIVPIFAVTLLFTPALPEGKSHAAGFRDYALLIGGGVATGLPLLWFTEAAKRIPYSILGFFQYIAPTLQFLIGVVIYHEAMSTAKVVGFVLIWIGIGWMIKNSLGAQQKNRIY